MKLATRWIACKDKSSVIFTDEICNKRKIDEMKTFDPIDEIYSTNEIYYVYIIIGDGVINMHAITNM
jgi:hypothetical protein